MLSLFVGAGVSIGAGLPSWGSLLGLIAKEARMSKEDVDRMWSLGFLDQARLLENRLGSVSRLRELITQQVSAAKFGLMHAMLAMLPCQSTVTTNYDTLFEVSSLCVFLLFFLRECTDGLQGGWAGAQRAAVPEWRQRAQVFTQAARLRHAS